MHEADPLLRERDYSFAEFREWCETYNIKREWVAFDFIQWLYSGNNSRAYIAPNMPKGNNG